jgi:ketosteroid isomerase-like protein
MNNAGKDAESVRTVLDRINTVWLTEEPDRIAEVLAPCFDERAIIVGPGFAPMAQGKQASIASYADFKRQATVHSCTFNEPVIHVAGDTAVVTNEWKIDYALSGSRYQESGRDVYVFTRVGDAWLAVWRAMLSD